ncbi:MAG TPA: hypothetical protein VFC15_04430, partial [Candidatus Limnocylindrales bacterium]|nr:hypothetical protein [Candidatus Limnocylindrales bacterium]
HYLFADKFGRPAKGNDKGKVEGLVGYIRRNFLVPIPKVASWEELNQRLLDMCQTLLSLAGFQVILIGRFWVIAEGCARASCTSWCRDTRGLCEPQWFGLGDECTRLSFERRGGVLWTDPPAWVGTSVASCCHSRAGCSRSVRMGSCKTSGTVHGSFEIRTV